MLVRLARAAGAALDAVLAGIARTAERGAERLGALGTGAGASDGAAQILRRAGILGRGDGTPDLGRSGTSSLLRTQVVESEPVRRRYLERLCQEQGHVVTTHADPQAACAALRRESPALVLIGGSFSSALASCRRLLGHADRRAALLVVVDWQGGRDHERAVRALGADDYLDAPAGTDWLRLRLESVAERVRRRTTTREAAARQEAMWADLAQRVAAAYAEQQATETTLRRAVGEWNSAEEDIRRALVDIDRRVSEKTGRLGAVEEAVAALAARPSRAGEPPAMAPAPARREIRIPVDTIPSLSPEGRGLTVAEREPLRIVKAVSEESASLAAAPGVRRPLGEAPPVADPVDEPVPGVPFALRGAVRTALEPLRQRAQQRKIGFGCHIAPDVPEAVVGDGGRFAQLLVHVVGHAIRSTDEGEVRVSVRRGAETPSLLVLLCDVADSSAGLGVEEQKHLFDALGREDEPVRTASGAAGLALAGHLVRSMGGRIWFESEVGHGTTVRFTMRLGVRSASSGGEAGAGIERSRPPAGAATGGLGILLIDDVAEDRLEAARVLERRGHRVVAVSEGHAALDAMASAPFDAVLLDLRLPRMDGFELAAVLRALEGRRGRRLPIVALTAMRLALDVERCAAVGIDACLRKPMDGDVALSTIVGLLAHPQRRAVPESA